MNKKCARAVLALIAMSTPALAQSVIVGNGSTEEVGAGAQVVVDPDGVVVQFGGSFVMAGSSSSPAQWMCLTGGAPISVQTGGSAQLSWAKLENLTTLAVAAGGKLLRVRETVFQDSLATGLPWIDISAVTDREGVAFSFNRVTFLGSTSRKNVKASASTPIVRMLGNTSLGNRWGEDHDDEPAGVDVLLWYTGVVTRTNPSGVYDTVEEALRASGTVAGSTITVNMGHTMIDDVVDFNTLPSNGASSSGPTVVSACLVSMVGKGILDSDIDTTRRGKVVNCVLARGAVEETTAENCTFFDPSPSSVIIMNNVDCKNTLIESAYSGSGNNTPSNCIAAVAEFFRSASTYDLHLASPGGNAAIDTGIVLAMNVDFEGTARPSIGKSGGSLAWDIGADELPCPPPQSLSVVVTGTSAILSWNAVSGATSYNVKRATSPSGSYSIVVGGSGVTQTSFTDNGLSIGTTYYYVVEASNSGGTSSNSNEVSAVPFVSAPSGVFAFGGTSQVSLSWNAVPGATGYNVRWSSTAGGPYSLIPAGTGISTASFTDTGIPNGITRYYVVTTLISASESALSAEALGTPIASPMGVMALGLDGRVSLNWASVSSATYYNVARSTVSGGPYYQVGSATLNMYEDSLGIKNGIPYYFVVTAVSANGESNPSTQASATPNPPAAGPGVLFVVGQTPPLTGDQAIQTELTNIGYTVTTKLDSQTAVADASGKALVVISSSATTIDQGYTTLSVPVLTWNGPVMGVLKMTGTAPGGDFGSISSQDSISILNQSLPMAAGRIGTVGVFGGQHAMTWSVPPSGAEGVATLVSDSSRSVIFGFATGSMMVWPQQAPARRAGFFLNNMSSATLGSEGVALFHAAVRWAAGAPFTPAAFEAKTNANGMAALSWGTTSGANSYTIRRATSPGGPYEVIASAITGASYVDTTVVSGQTYYYLIEASGAGGISAASAAVTFQGGVPGVAGAYAFGRPYLKSRNGGNPLNVWHQGTYEMFPEANLVNGSGQWGVLAPFNQSLLINRIDDTHVLLTVKPGETGPMKLTVRYTATKANPTSDPIIEDFPVVVDRRKRLVVNLRFPVSSVTDTQDRTQRNEAFFGNLATRTTARQAFAQTIRERLSIHDSVPGNIPTNPPFPNLEQANIGVYIQTDVSYKDTEQEEQLNVVRKGFDDQHRFVAGKINALGGSTDSAGLVNLQTFHNPTISEIDIYFVREIRVAGFGLIPCGYAIQGENRRTILIGDNAGEGDVLAQVIAHEIGHILHLNHPEEELLMAGYENITEAAINNPIPIVAPETLLWQYNLMHRDVSLATWLTNDQCKRVYDVASKHWALMQQVPED